LEKLWEDKRIRATKLKIQLGELNRLTSRGEGESFVNRGDYSEWREYMVTAKEAQRDPLF